MTGYLLDTNVLSELGRPDPDAGVLARLAEVDTVCSVASVTWHELRYGVDRLPTGRRRSALDALLAQLATRFPVLPYDRAAAEWHGAQRVRLERAGRTAPFADGEVAAVAAIRGLRLVTRNLTDFAGYDDLVVETWW